MLNPPTRTHSVSGYLSEDTIAAIATELGGAIAVIRVSGPEALSSLSTLIRSGAQAEPRQMVRATLFQPNGDSLDDALFVKFVAPHSYTGEDVVEYHIHGNGFIAHRLLETLGTLGIRQALPGEFSFRAVKNGKMNLFQAQAVADLIAASNDQAVSLALEKLSGSQDRFLKDLAESIRRLAALGEVGIDFADQDIEEVSLPQLKPKANRIIEILETLKSSYQRGIRLQEGCRVAFVGLPNAGKSSFFNLLLGEDRSIVSDIAGTTRDVVREKLTLQGKRTTITLRLEDTAGLRSAHDPIEQQGIERSRQSTRNADLVLLIMDPTQPPQAVTEQWKLLSTDGESGSTETLATKTIGIVTKSDLATAEQITTSISLFQSFGITRWAITSALSGKGTQEAIETLVETCDGQIHRKRGELILTRLDHLTAVTNAIEHLQRAKLAPEIDLFASDIRQALHSLGPLIGQTLPDDILGKIFSDFCIGK